MSHFCELLLLLSVFVSVFVSVSVSEFVSHAQYSLHFTIIEQTDTCLYHIIVITVIDANAILHLQLHTLFPLFLYAISPLSFSLLFFHQVCPALLLLAHHFCMYRNVQISTFLISISSHFHIHHYHHIHHPSALIVQCSFSHIHTHNFHTGIHILNYLSHSLYF